MWGVVFGGGFNGWLSCWNISCVTKFQPPDPFLNLYRDMIIEENSAVTICIVTSISRFRQLHTCFRYEGKTLKERTVICHFEGKYVNNYINRWKCLVQRSRFTWLLIGLSSNWPNYALLDVPSYLIHIRDRGAYDSFGAWTPDSRDFRSDFIDFKDFRPRDFRDFDDFNYFGRFRPISGNSGRVSEISAI